MSGWSGNQPPAAPGTGGGIPDWLRAGGYPGDGPPTNIGVDDRAGGVATADTDTIPRTDGGGGEPPRQEPPEGRPGGQGPRSSWRRRVAAGGLAVALTVGGGAVGALITQQNQPATTAGTVVAPTGETGSAGGSSTSAVEEATQALLPVVVDVSASGLRGTGGGSGVIMREDGYILTNNHVVEGAQSVTVTLSTGERLEADVVGTDAAHDIAVLRVDRTGLPAATFGRSSEIGVGEAVIAVGSPFGLSGTATTGIVSALDRVINASSGQAQESEQIVGAIQTDAAINPGNSGGALATTSGQVIGINTAIASSSGGNTGVGFAIPSDTALEVANQLIAGETVEVPYLGVGGNQEVTEQQAAQYGITDRTGALVLQVGDNTPAAQGGLQVGDLVVEFDGQPVHSWDDLIVATRNAEIGQQVEMVVVRGGQEQTLTVTPGARPSS